MSGKDSRFLIKVAVLFLFVFIVIGGGIFVIDGKSRYQSAETISFAIREPLLLGDYRAAIYSLERSVSQQFDEIQYQDESGKVRFILPIGNISSVWNRKFEIPVEMGGRLVFKYSPFRIFVWISSGFAFSLLLVGVWVVRFRRQIDQEISLKIEREREALLVRVAAQVAHDIRSPVSALISLADGIPNLTSLERTRLRGVATSIREVAEGFLNTNRGSEIDLSSVNSGQSHEEGESVPLTILIREVVADKNLEHSEKKLALEVENTEFSVHADPAELRRIFSNLLNNAIEATKCLPCRVLVNCTSLVDDVVRVQFRDFGNGIPQEIFDKLGQRGVSYGKNNGNGLGLSHARECLERWGGQWSIESTIGIGTSVFLDFRKVAHPDWYDDLSSVNSPMIRLGKGDSFTSEIQSRDDLIHWYRENLDLSEQTVFVATDHYFRDQPWVVEALDQIGCLPNLRVLTSRYPDDAFIAAALKVKAKIVYDAGI